MSTRAFLDGVGRWAGTQPEIHGIALVGSRARGGGSASSDVDLLILTPTVARYLQDRTWLSLFGEVRECRVEERGRVTSLRAFYTNGLEVEYGFAAPSLAEPPVEADTVRVVTGGVRVVYDPRGILADLRKEVDREN